MPAFSGKRSTFYLLSRIFLTRIYNVCLSVCLHFLSVHKCTRPFISIIIYVRPSLSVFQSIRIPVRIYMFVSISVSQSNDRHNSSLTLLYYVVSTCLLVSFCFSLRETTFSSMPVPLYVCPPMSPFSF